jgi:hypothetical protein
MTRAEKLRAVASMFRERIDERVPIDHIADDADCQRNTAEAFEEIEAAACEIEAGRACVSAIRLALPILDDDLLSFRGDTPPRLWDERGFVCLDDLHCDHDRWVACEATLKALLAIRGVLPEAEWSDGTYAETQKAVEHFARASEAGGAG